MYLVKIYSMDGRPISKKTNFDVVLAKTLYLPFEGAYQEFIFQKELDNGNGVIFYIENLERENNIFYFNDLSKRCFKVELIKKI